MRPRTIVWDFDGTLLPSVPDDSEQYFLHQCLRRSGSATWWKKLLGRGAIFADRNEWLGRRFKTIYLYLLRDTPAAMIGDTAASLARRIGSDDRQTLRTLHSKGYRMLVVSCGTLDLCLRTLEAAGIAPCFEKMLGNRLLIRDGRIRGMEAELLEPRDKLTALQRLAVDPSDIIAVGDGYTDVPLLDRARVPVVVDRSGVKRDFCRRRGYRRVRQVPDLLEWL